MRFSLIFLTAIFLILTQVQSLVAATIQMVDGSEHSGDIVAISSNGQLTLRQNGERKQLRCADIVEIFNEGRTPTLPNLGVKLTTGDGDYILATVTDGNDATLQLQSSSLGSHTMLFDYIAEIRVIENHSREELFRPARPQGSEDIVKLNEESTPYKGTLLQIGQKGVTMETDLFPDGVPLGYSKIKWISLALLEEMKPASAGLVGIIKCVDGSRVSGIMKGLENNTLRVQTRYELEFKISMKNISSISFRNGSFTYMSDLEPVKVHQNYQFDDSTLQFDYQKDTSVSGNPLTLRGKIYRKGLGVHANNRLTYALQGNYKRFRCEIGIDDEVIELHNKQYAGVIFIVTADGKELFSSDLITAQSAIQKLDLDVSGAQSLTLEVKDGNGTISQDRANWANAFLLK